VCHRLCGQVQLACLAIFWRKMRLVVQRVTEAFVLSEGIKVAEITAGLMILIGIGSLDTEADARWVSDKLVRLRIFEDDQGKMNQSILDTKGSVLLVSQFTLFGDCRKGNRPGFSEAAKPDIANLLYEKVAEYCRNHGVPTFTGVFQTDMKVSLVNDGPVTLLLDSKKSF